MNRNRWYRRIATNHRIFPPREMVDELSRQLQEALRERERDIERRRVHEYLHMLADIYQVPRPGSVSSAQTDENAAPPAVTASNDLSAAPPE